MFDQNYLNDLTGLDNQQPPSALWMATQQSLFPNAHAYDMSFWDIAGIMASLIGLDSLEVIWDQVGNMLAGRDVDIVSMTIAILDVLTLFPPAAPLKLVIAPVKLAVKLLRVGNNQAVRYLGGVMKRVYQNAKNRDFTLVFQGVAFFIVVADMVQDEEAREGMAELAKMINSTDDFLALLEFVSLADPELIEKTVLNLHNQIEPDRQYAELSPLATYFPQAHAKVPLGIGKAWGRAIKELKPMLEGTTGVAAKALRQFAKEVRAMPPKQRKRLVKHAFSKGMIKGLLTATKHLGPKGIIRLLKGFHGQRIHPMVLLAIMGYIEEQIATNQLFPDTMNALDQVYYKKQFVTLIVKAIPTFARAGGNVQLIRAAQGAAFHLMQLAILQAKSQAGGAKVIGIEVPRDVLLFPSSRLINRKQTDEALIFGRDVDIMTGTKNTAEVWWETKSYNKKKNTKDEPSYLDGWHWLKGAREAPSDYELLKLKGSGTHKQFILDQVAKKLGVIPGKNELSRHNETQPKTPSINVSSFKWVFHKFKANTKTVKNNNPSLLKIQKKLTKLPVGVNPALFKAHTNNTAGPKSVIKLSGIKSFLTDVPTELKEAIIEDMQALNYE